jgi:hypothetical protein
MSGAASSSSTAAMCAASIARSSAAGHDPPQRRACPVRRSVIATVDLWFSVGNQPEPKLMVSSTRT